MSASITHRYGHSEDYSPDKIPELIAELDAYVDDEHPDVWVSCGGWTLSAFPSGLVIWEDDVDEAPRHLRGVSRSRLAVLMELCATGRFHELERLPWMEGYG
ncbi:hypothetical protein AB0B66_12940 [Catellatospora sp. NPDC049111]|uniref:hypothetical protein n=1 Tax=Catellatospora sp. NPDC049111 TaxID=3155271 RepID=UPI0033FC57A8